MATYKGLNKDKSGNILLPIAANSAPVETTLTASQAYAVGEYFQYSNNLYQVTRAIASGGTITIGTNCTLIPSLGAEISKLNSSLTASDNTKFEFCYDSVSGKYGYKDGADTFRPFSSGCAILNVLTQRIIQDGPVIITLYHSADDVESISINQTDAKDSTKNPVDIGDFRITISLSWNSTFRGYQPYYSITALKTGKYLIGGTIINATQGQVIVNNAWQDGGSANYASM